MPRCMAWLPKPKALHGWFRHRVVSTHAHAHTRTHTRARTHAHAHTRTHTYAHTRAHAYTYTHARTPHLTRTHAHAHLTRIHTLTWATRCWCAQCASLSDERSQALKRAGATCRACTGICVESLSRCARHLAICTNRSKKKKKKKKGYFIYLFYIINKKDAMDGE